LTKVKSPCRLSVAKAEKTTQAEKKIGTTFLSYYFYKLFFQRKKSLLIQKQRKQKKKLYIK
jgi:hypothetical protein